MLYGYNLAQARRGLGFMRHLACCAGCLFRPILVTGVPSQRHLEFVSGLQEAMFELRVRSFDMHALTTRGCLCSWLACMYVSPCSRKVT